MILSGSVLGFCRDKVSKVSKLYRLQQQGTVFYKGIAGIESMQSMTYEFNQENVAENIYRFMGEKEKEYLPHSVTVNEYLERLSPDELQKVQQKQVYGLSPVKPFMMPGSRKNGW